MRLLLAGASPELLGLARTLGHEVVALSDPAIGADTWYGLPAAPGDESAIEIFRPDAVAIAIDDARARERVQQAFETLGVAVASLIGGYKGEDATHGDGLVAQRLSNLSEGCRLGRGVRLNVGANVMHETVLGDFVTVAPNAVLLGRVRVGNHSYIGANATILPDVAIGSGCLVGAGAVVTRDVPDGATVKGNPAQ